MTDNSSSTPGSIPEKLNESLSALVDGEQNDFDLQRILKNLDEDASGDAIRKAWSRYHLVGVAMRKEVRPNLSVDIAAAVSAAIADEELPTQGSEDKPRSAKVGLGGWWTGIGKTAVAASVALGVVFAAQQFTSVSSDGTVGTPAVAANDAEVNELSGAVVPQGFELPPLAAQTVSANAFSPQQVAPRSLPSSGAQGTVVISGEEFREQMNRLIYKHAEQVSTSSALGVIPYARIAEARALSDGQKAKEANKGDTAKGGEQSASRLDSQNEVVKEAR